MPDAVETQNKKVHVEERFYLNVAHGYSQDYECKATMRKCTITVSRAIPCFSQEPMIHDRVVCYIRLQNQVLPT